MAAALSVFVSLPFIWVLGLSLKRGADVLRPGFLPQSYHLDNYLIAWAEFGLGQSFVNSLVVTATTLLVTLVLAIGAAYGFAALRFRWSNSLFAMVLLGIMIPPAAVIIPLFVELKAVGLYNHLFGVSIGLVPFGLPISIVILRAFFQSVAKELIEAARIDGASEVRVLVRVVIPISRAPIAVVTVLIFLGAWNDLLISLILLTDTDLYTIPLSTAAVIGQYVAPYELIAAAVMIAAAPVIVLYLAMHSQFERGVAEGAVKG